MYCSICEKEIGAERKYLALYVSGSEGIDVCPECDRELCEVVRILQRIGGRSKMVLVERQRKGEEKE